MRSAIAISLLAVMSVSVVIAQQEPPVQTKPAETAPPKTDAPKPETPAVETPKAETPAAPKPGTAADPMKMAAPNPSGPKKPVASAVDDKVYILGPEDQISVFVYQGNEFTGSHMIRPDGKITVNLVGDVQASGLTPEALALSIKERVKAYLNDPDVTVSVLAVKSKKFLINGEVNKPGEYPLVVPTRVFQALVNAGGFRDFANKSKITIIHENNKRDTFNYKEVLAGKKLEQNIYLEPGDIIVVK
jgi:polysaccharide biosynthesis/export protein